MDTLTHYTQQAALAGSATHVAALIRKYPSYSAQELAELISAIAAHAAHMDTVGLYRFDEVSALLDNAADIAEDSYLVGQA
jgi:hypothetical protein